MKRPISFAVRCIAALCVLAAQAAFPDSVPVFSADPATMGFDEFAFFGPGMYGWAFFLRQPATVNAIGWYDDSQDGLNQSHQIGLWQGPLQSISNLLLSITMPAGTEAPLDGSWRRLDLSTHLTLQPGNYLVAGTYDSQFGDTVRFVPIGDNPSPRVDPRVAFFLPLFSVGGFQPPDQVILASGAEFGPMLFVETIPEPGALSLCAAGLSLLLLTGARRRFAARFHAKERYCSDTWSKPALKTLKTTRNIQSRGHRARLIIAALCVLAAQAAFPDSVPVYRADPATMGFDEFAFFGQGMYGWVFYLRQTATVNAIGWYDDSRDGLNQSHQIGLWQGPLQSISNLLLSITMPAGTEVPLDGSWRRLDLAADLTLDPGEYIVGGTYNSEFGDPVRFVPIGDNPSPRVDPRFTHFGPLFSVGGFQPPDQAILASGAEFGPMLFVETIPEPGALSLCAAGLSLLLLTGARRRFAARSFPTRRRDTAAIHWSKTALKTLKTTRNIQSRRHRTRLIIAALCALAAQVCRADSVPVYSADPATLGFDEFAFFGPGMYGWAFFLRQPATVNAIGWYDDSRDGLNQSHQIGLWQGPLQSISNLLLSITMPAGTKAPLDGSWRRLDLSADLTLQPGNYLVAGTYDSQFGDTVRFVRIGDNPDPQVDPRFTYFGPLFSIGGFRPPDQVILASGAEFGPMLFVETIPEPDALSLCAAGLSLLLLTRARRPFAAGFPCEGEIRHRYME